MLADLLVEGLEGHREGDNTRSASVDLVYLVQSVCVLGFVIVLEVEFVGDEGAGELVIVV